MKQKLILFLLAVSLLLTGCSWPSERYVSVTPHREQRQNAQSEVASAANYLGLIQVLKDMIEGGTEEGAINIADYPADYVESGMELAVEYAMTTYPLGAYAVEDITYEVGTTGGLPAMAVNITYRHSDVEIRQIRDLADMSEAEPLVAAALEDYDASLVMSVEKYMEVDFQQMVRDYAETYPETVMEIPQVTVGVYGSGAERVVELSFAYQTSRDSLRQMQRQVEPVFEAAELYVSGDAADRQKFSQLYAFLTERFDYTLETSITPAYSLLHHGVGDSRAFATVYAAMCRRAGLTCMVVTGTRSGEPWVWNIVLDNGNYQHVDLLQCSAAGKFRELPDRDMAGYVWDYSAYPECQVIRPAETAEEGTSQPQQSESAAEPVQTESTEPTAAATEPAEVPAEPEETHTEPAVSEEPAAPTEAEEIFEEF